MNKKELKIGTTFSGIGSPEFALKHIYGKEYKNKVTLQWACDFETNAIKSFKANHNPKRFYENIYYMTNSKEDILNMPDDFIKKTAKEKVRQLDTNFFNLKNISDVDMYIFGFPCQNFSLANKNRDTFNLSNVDTTNTHMHQKDLGYNATKTTLVFESMKIIKELSQRKNPLKTFIAENVKGLVQHDPAYIWKELEDMTESEYDNLSKEKKKNIVKEEVSGKIVYKRKENGLILDGKNYKGYPSLVNEEYDGNKKYIGKTLYVIENAFIELGYKIKWKVLNAKDYSFGEDENITGGVQNRERIFIVGVKNDIEEEFFFPIPEKIVEGKEDKVINYLNENNNKNKDLVFDKSVVNEKEKKRESTGVCNQTHYLNNVKYEQGQRIYDAEKKSPCLTCVGEPRFFIKEGNKEIFRKTDGKEMLAIQGFPIGNKNRGIPNEDGTYNIPEFNYEVSDLQLKKQAGNSMSVSTMKALMEELIKVI